MAGAGAGSSVASSTLAPRPPPPSPPPPSRGPAVDGRAPRGALSMCITRPLWPASDFFLACFDQWPKAGQEALAVAGGARLE